MPEHHRGRLTKGSRWLQLLDRLLRLRKFGLHQPWGGNCHQETSGLMGWIYALLSSFSAWSKLEEAKSLIWSLFSVSFHRLWCSNDKLWNLSLNLSTVMPLYSPKVNSFLCPNFTCQDKFHSSLREVWCWAITTVWFSNQFDKSSQNCKTVLEQIIAWHPALAEEIWLKTDVWPSGFWVYMETLCSVPYDITVRCQ